MLKLVAIGRRDWSYNNLAIELDISPSQAHSAVRRALSARLALRHNGGIAPQTNNLEEFLVHGLKYLCIPQRGELTRGIPIAHGAPPLVNILTEPQDIVPVWPHPESKVCGESFSPIFRSAPEASMRDSKLYQLLALVDAIRGGRSRERTLSALILRGESPPCWLTETLLILCRAICPETPEAKQDYLYWYPA